MDQASGDPLVHPLWFDASLHWLSLSVEAVGVLVIVVGAIAATVRLLPHSSRPRGYGPFAAYRAGLAQAILLGLEFLVAADIIGTVAVRPTLTNLAVLGFIVLLRTALSFLLELEIEGRWPWQKRQDSAH